jgi:hypothetical protein
MRARPAPRQRFARTAARRVLKNATADASFLEETGRKRPCRRTPSAETNG